MKKLLSLIICAAVILSSFTISAFAAEEDNAIASGDYTYILKGNDAQIIKYTGNNTEVNVPETIDGHKVIKVGYDLVSIESYYSSRYEGVNYESKLGKYGFGEKDVISVTIPDSVTQLGVGCFSDCKKLKNVTLSKNLTFIPIAAFSGCESLENINLPDKIEEICSTSFSATKIESLKLPKNLNYINTGQYDFYKTPLKKFTVDKDNKNYSAKDGVLYNKKKNSLVYYPKYKTNKSFTIPRSVTDIRCFAFSLHNYLEKIVVSENVKRIGSNAFEGCKKLKSVTFKNRKALTLNEECFYRCEKLSKVKFSTKAKTTICMNAFSKCKNLKEVYLPKKVRIKSFGIGYTEAYYSSEEEDYITQKIKGFTIKGKKNSPAHKYAKKNKFKFISV